MDHLFGSRNPVFLKRDNDLEGMVAIPPLATKEFNNLAHRNPVGFVFLVEHVATMQPMERGCRQMPARFGQPRGHCTHLRRGIERARARG